MNCISRINCFIGQQAGVCLLSKAVWLGVALSQILLNWVIPSKPPVDARVCVFHGNPNPDDALAGRWPGSWYKKLRLHIGSQIIGMNNAATASH